MGVKKLLLQLFTKKNLKNYPKKHQQFIQEITRLVGYSINDESIFIEAFSLKDNNSKKLSNYERLEFLGDSVLGTIISFYLYENYPYKNEGFLTQMKSKIVNRINLNKLGENLNLIQLIQNNNPERLTFSKNISGNLFESLIGAIFIDAGYEVCKTIVLTRLMPPEEIKKLENQIISYKGLLMEWGQKTKQKICYITEEDSVLDHKKNFKSTLFIDQQKIAHASGSSKKKAEEKAAQRAFYSLNPKEKILEN